jgi:hypothetical protein
MRQLGRPLTSPSSSRSREASSLGLCGSSQTNCVPGRPRYRSSRASFTSSTRGSKWPSPGRRSAARAWPPCQSGDSSPGEPAGGLFPGGGCVPGSHGGRFSRLRPQVASLPNTSEPGIAVEPCWAHRSAAGAKAGSRAKQSPLPRARAARTVIGSTRILRGGGQLRPVRPVPPRRHHDIDRRGAWIERDVGFAALHLSKHLRHLDLE